MNKVVLAPQGFKESLTGMEIAEAMAIGVKRVWPKAETVLIPVADGGDGTLQALVDSSGGEVRVARVEDAIGRTIDAAWGALGNGTTAVIEVANAVGLARLDQDERDVRNASTYGVGQLFTEALDAGFTDFIIGVGGSATNDAGAGMIQAMGGKLINADGNVVARGGVALSDLANIDVSELDPRMSLANVVVACDVINPLCGPRGASAIFGPQKGATQEDIKELDAALANFADVIAKDLHTDVADIPGAGASGGLGAGLMGFFDARLRLGADIVLEAVNLEEHLKDAELVIVGEGQFDRSTVFNKSPVAVAQRAKRNGTPVIGISGSFGGGFAEVHEHGIDAIFSLVNRPMSLKEAMGDTKRLVAIATEQACRAIAISI
ncbi:MAG: glycerate kinase [Dehalococcoidia bacterium]|jgi:glycerate kinase|nr:glycerate kinase [Chloroflexota bacterium]MDP6056242.1 glycerate kinase [Dehalococcoidia bacterium]MDP7261439.1 glycerate kinase [Dehalococcoidia bacterium]|tara:strand:+ start:2440 stop:3576 length:1137 start_codon:yes stop_codon:yes gene_type:complete